MARARALHKTMLTLENPTTFLSVIQSIKVDDLVQFDENPSSKVSQISQVIKQSLNRWLIDSSSRLHKMHLFIMILRLFLRLSQVEVLPHSRAHTNKLHFKGTASTQTLPTGKFLILTSYICTLVSSNNLYTSHT